MDDGSIACIDYWQPGEIVEANDYYPFGLLHNYAGTTMNAYQRKYNGKELQENGMYDYGARFYMPDIGRWGVVDPLAETSRRFNPYNYAYNNPIMFIDPDGRQGTDWIKKDNKWTYDANITTVAQAQAAGADAFAENGSVVSNTKIGADGEAGYVRLNEGGTADYMPNNLSTALVNFSNETLGGTITNINHEEFPQLTDPGGMARNDFDASSHDKLRPGDKTFILDIGNIPIPGNASTLRIPNIAEIFKNLESIGFTDAPDWYKFKSQPDTLFMKATFVGSGKDFLRDTMFAEPYRKNETYEQVKNRQGKKYDSVKTNSKIFLTR